MDAFGSKHARNAEADVARGTNAKITARFS